LSLGWQVPSGPLTISSCLLRGHGDHRTVVGFPEPIRSAPVPVEFVSAGRAVVEKLRNRDVVLGNPKPVEPDLARGLAPKTGRRPACREFTRRHINELHPFAFLRTVPASGSCPALVACTCRRPAPEAAESPAMWSTPTDNVSNNLVISSNLYAASPKDISLRMPVRHISHSGSERIQNPSCKRSTTSGGV